MITYKGMHSRVTYERGPAQVHKCAECGEQAQDWARNAPDCVETLYGQGRAERRRLNPYCLHVEHYEPRCTKCHMALDKPIPIELLVI